MSLPSAPTPAEPLAPPLTPPLAQASVLTPGTPPPVAPFIRLTRLVAVAALLGLIVLGLAWELWLAPTGQRTLAIKVLPLVLPLAGLLKHKLYTYRWVSLMVWLYFTEGAVRAWGDEPGWGPTLALVQVLLCLVLFAACAAHVRWRLRHKTEAGTEATIEAATEATSQATTAPSNKPTTVG